MGGPEGGGEGISRLGDSYMRRTWEGGGVGEPGGEWTVFLPGRPNIPIYTPRHTHIYTYNSPRGEPKRTSTHTHMHVYTHTEIAKQAKSTHTLTNPQAHLGGPQYVDRGLVQPLAGAVQPGLLRDLHGLWGQQRQGELGDILCGLYRGRGDKGLQGAGVSRDHDV